MSAKLIYFLASVTFVWCGIPDYWKDRTYTTNNGTQNTPIPFTIEARNTEYNEKDSPRDSFLRTSLLNFTHIDLWDKTNEPPVNRSGTLHRLVLNTGYITQLEVLEELGDDGTVPVRLHTTWFKEKTDESVDHDPFYLEDAMVTDTMLNISMNLEWEILSQDETDKVNKDRFWVIDEYLCHYAGTSARIVNNQCVIPYTEVIEYFRGLWEYDNVTSEFAKATRDRVSNDYPWLKDVWKCSYSEYGDSPLSCPLPAKEKIEYLKPEDVWLPTIKTWYRYVAFPLGMGYATNLTYGHNKTIHSYDFNFTIIFNKWTFDFPSDFLAAFRDFSFKYDKLKFDVWYWREDPPVVIPREEPASFFIMVCIMIFPFTVLVFGFIFLLLFRANKKGFDTNIWRYWKHKYDRGITEKTEKTMKKEYLQEKVDERKTKEFLEAKEKGQDNPEA
ncbi:uncharacterized protein [Clytia hemisphaerica]|uniref:Uncharacterized protein n=1 Tax=Clytia hemisphaerica TaxID=252671 RepID=A0A7M5V7U1_9CNID